jgi:hypothetical protein
MSLTTKLVENSENDMAWYRLYFQDKGLILFYFILFLTLLFFFFFLNLKHFIYYLEHENFISTDNDGDPFVLSIIRELDRRSIGKFYQYRAIVWLKTVSPLEHLGTLLSEC